MNINTGGPHILLFERDRQLTALLTSEFQLAGYECHAARTAVEVFDAIARYPVRLVLVNLAQAAAARREFWVALDTQRRGRGVQVLTFYCMNLAGYGPADPDESAHTRLADMEVDGMLGVMNLVDAVRRSIPVSGSNTGAFSRLSNTTVQQGNAPLLSTTASSASMASPSPSSADMKRSYGEPTSIPNPPSPVPPPPDVRRGSTNTATPTPAYTDKIRAVIYPSPRAWSASGEGGSSSSLQATQEGDWSSQNSQNPAIPPPLSNSSLSTATAPRPVVGQVDTRQQPYIYPRTQLSSDMSGAPARSEAPLHPAQSEQKESGLAQLSRMVQEHQPSLMQDDLNEASLAANQPAQEEQQARMPRPPEAEPQYPGEAMRRGEPTLQPTRPVASAEAALSKSSLRASPIEDLPTDRIVGGQGEPKPEYRLERPDLSARPNFIQQPSPVSAPSSPNLPTIEPEPIERNSDRVKQTHSEPLTEEKSRDGAREEDSREGIVEQIRAIVQGPVRRLEAETSMTSESTLLDIVQSLPPMPSPPPQPPQPPVLSGRATRSLGSVLLEGHLVPQNRLEVAQNIQRMLRGVDMNYQLGEILLMFRLLTPDQLLAASLVSYGLISTTQISALGRIRQELHSIGLEYDLESLLVLFRILTPEQLREVRASWSG